MTSLKNCIAINRKWNEKSLQERNGFLYEIITPVLHIEGQEEEYEEKYEDDFDLE
ncbi:hypothetical protein HpCHC88_13080 [Helicobacter pylori]